MPAPEKLILLPSLTSTLRSDGKFRLTRKFVAGAVEMERVWRQATGGPVEVWIEEGERPENLDEDWFGPDDLPCRVTHVDYQRSVPQEDLEGVRVILGATSHRQNHLAAEFHSHGVPLVYATEYTLRTRIQIAETEERSVARRYRRQLWEVAEEKRRRRAIAQASGLQCNGTPTFEAYRGLNRRTHLYFDTRTREDAVISREQLDRRLDGFGGRPLRLAFSGRFTRMKGVQLLPALAGFLRDRKVDFHLSLCGDGELRESIEAEVAERNLGEYVSFLGNLPFESELIPFLKHSVDLFVCPHLQGDPSCTYLETFAAGIPIAGFANEAFAGLLDTESNLGWSAPTGEVYELARQIEILNQQRRLLESASHTAREFALAHTFEQETRRRIRHLCHVARPTSTLRMRAVTGSAATKDQRSVR
ncbi:MAG: glycosyltransferase [Myxococcota bacterium]